MMKMNRDQLNLMKAYNMLLYFAGSMIMNEPTEECVIDFWREGSLNKLPVKSSNPRFFAAASILRESCGDKDLCKNMLCDDYFRLFDIKGLALAPARESAYAGKNDNTANFHETAGEFYRSYGWKSESQSKISEDHLGIELLFLTRLVDNYMQIDDDPSCREMKNEIRRFIDQHLLSWIPEWNDNVQKNAHTLCYKGIGTLIHACVEDIYLILS
jgi:TorA maturation chaperone TorD